MSLVTPGKTYDGFKSLEGGIDSGRAPNLLPVNKAAFARNVSFRGGNPQTRPGWIKRALSFPDEDTQELFEPLLFQGAGAYLGNNARQEIIFSISGRIFKVNVGFGYTVEDITLSGDTNSSKAEMTWMEQGEEFLAIQNGTQSPIIYDGSTVYRVDPNSDPRGMPVGTAMAYSGGRFWVVRPNRKSFVAGNIVGGEGGTASYQGRDSILVFSENDFLNEGGEFGVPAPAGEIRALKTIGNLDTSLGQGPLQVVCERGVFSVNAPFDRTTWKDLNYPIQTISILGAGGQGQWSTVVVNGDMWFRDINGLRSFQMCRRDFASWVNTPLSSEMKTILDIDDRNLLEFSSGARFDNRLIETANGQRKAGHGVVFKSLISLDFHNVSGIGERTAPAYDGIWTGLDVLKLVEVGDRTFIIALNNDSRIELWEMTLSDPNDNLTTRISCYLDTRSMGYEDSGMGLKRLDTSDLWVDQIRTNLDISMAYRPDQYPVFTDWHSWAIKAKTTQCLTSCSSLTTLKPQYRNRQSLPVPLDPPCNDKLGTPMNQGYELQFRIAWTGCGRLIKFRTLAVLKEERSSGFCQPDEEEDETGLSACDSTLFEYSAL